MMQCHDDNHNSDIMSTLDALTKTKTFSLQKLFFCFAITMSHNEYQVLFIITVSYSKKTNIRNPTCLWSEVGIV